MLILQFVNFGPLMWGAVLVMDQEGNEKSGFFKLVLDSISIACIGHFDTLISTLYFHIVNLNHPELFSSPKFLVMKSASTNPYPCPLLLSFYYLHFLILSSGVIFYKSTGLLDNLLFTNKTIEKDTQSQSDVHSISSNATEDND